MHINYSKIGKVFLLASDSVGTFLTGNFVVYAQLSIVLVKPKQDNLHDLQFCRSM